MVKIITIIRNGKRFDFPKDKLVTDLNKLKKYGTSEGAKAGWDARGRGRKEDASERKGIVAYKDTDSKGNTSYQVYKDGKSAGQYLTEQEVSTAYGENVEHIDGLTEPKSGKSSNTEREIKQELNELKLERNDAYRRGDKEAVGNIQERIAGLSPDTRQGDVPWASVPKTHQDAIIAIATDGYLSREMKEGGIKAIMDSIPKNKKPKKKG